MNRKIVFMVAIALTVIVGSTSLGCATTKTITWNLQGFQLNYETLPMPQSLKLAENVSERTNGNFTINVALEGELGVHRDNYNEAAQAGTVELIQHSSPLLERIIPHMGVYHLPQLGVDPGDWEELMWELADRDQAAMQEFGFQMVTPECIYADWNQELYTIDPIDPTDMSGESIRVWQVAMEEVIAKLSGEPVYMAFTEVYMALERGVITGFMTGASPAANMSVWEVCSQFYPAGFPGGGRYLVVNTEAFESLPEEYQTILVEEAAAYGASSRAGVASAIEAALAEFADRGMVLNEFTDEERAAWRDVSLPLWDTYAKAAPENEEILNIAKDLLLD